MKKLLFIAGIIISQSSTAQQMLGIANSNFSGSAGMGLNPASMLFMPYTWEATLINLNISADNNYLSYSEAKNSGQAEGIATDNHGGLIADDSPVDKSANFHVMLKTPSFIYKTKKMAFGFHTAFRNDGSIRNVPAPLAKYFYEGKDYAPLYGTSIDLQGLHGGAMTWAEAGISVGKVLNKDEENIWMVAVTLKYINAFQGAYLKVNSGSLNVVNDSIVYPDNLNAEFEYAVPNNPAYLISYPPGQGAAFDFGVCYVSNPYDGKATLNDALNKKYNYRLGISLLDFGIVSFINNANKYHYNVRLSSDIRNIDSLIEAGHVGDKYMMGLPAAISLQYDNCIVPRWFLNFTAVQRVPLLMAQVDRANNLSASLRYETTSFEIGVPYSLYDYSQLRIGFALRYKVLFLGTDKLGTFVHVKDDQISGADFYFGVKLTNFSFLKKPKARKPCPSLSKHDKG